jgi:hypothetical protein
MGIVTKALRNKVVEAKASLLSSSRTIEEVNFNYNQAQ